MAKKITKTKKTTKRKKVAKKKPTTPQLPKELTAKVLSGMAKTINDGNRANNPDAPDLIPLTVTVDGKEKKRVRTDVAGSIFEKRMSLGASILTALSVELFKTVLTHFGTKTEVTDFLTHAATVTGSPTVPPLKPRTRKLKRVPPSIIRVKLNGAYVDAAKFTCTKGHAIKFSTRAAAHAWLCNVFNQDTADGATYTTD